MKTGKETSPAKLAKWIKPRLFSERTGYSLDALNAKRKTGVWEEGAIWKKAPDGNILYCMEAYEAWAESGSKAA